MCFFATRTSYICEFAKSQERKQTSFSGLRKSAEPLVATLNDDTLRNITAIILTIFLFACGQKNPKDKEVSIIQSNKPENQLSNYIQKPADTDSMCIKDIEKAKKDVSNGKIVFCFPMGFGSHDLRQEKQLRELCLKNNLIFKYELFSDVIYDGQTQGCYGAYMDKTISSKFGSNFKQNLLKQADSILLATNDTIVYYKCDKRPQIPGKDDYETTLEAKVPEKLSKQLKADKEGDLPFMDIGFYIDKSGNASGYFLNYFMDANSKSNQKFKDELFKIGVEQLKAIKHWETGFVNGQKVNTENNVRVYF